jgi:hypothetical protein
MNLQKSILTVFFIFSPFVFFSCNNNNPVTTNDLLPKNNKKLIEMFTNTRCTVCPPANEYCTSIEHGSGITNDDSSIIIIRYHTTLYPNDPFYDFNPIDNLARQTMYIAGTANPKAYLDGAFMGVFNSSAWTAQINNSLQFKNPLSIEIGKQYPQGERVGNTVIKISNFEISPSDSLLLFVMLTESPVNYSAPNGETVFYDVLRYIITTYQGYPIILNQNQNSFYEFPIILDSVINENNVYINAFVQNKKTLQIYGVEKTKLINP